VPPLGRDFQAICSLIRFLEYHEFIVNGLDPLSFLLVTSKILKVLEPKIRKPEGVVLSVFLSLSYVAYYLYTHLHKEVSDTALFLNITIGRIFSAVISMVVLESRVGRRVSEIIANYLFWVGFTFFIISRIIAFLAATVHAFYE
jgi:hypothetical protein